MGMAASQARYLALVARKSNCEYEGQQINQARLLLSNQSANLFNQMLGLTVPVPPSTQDFTKTQYSYSDGVNNSVIDSWKQLSNDPEYNYVVTSHYYTDIYTGSVKKMTDPQVQVSNATSSASLGDWDDIKAAYDALTAAQAVRDSSYTAWQTTKAAQERVIDSIKRQAIINNNKNTITNLTVNNGVQQETGYKVYNFGNAISNTYHVQVFDDIDSFVPGNYSIDVLTQHKNTAVENNDLAQATDPDDFASAQAYAIATAKAAVDAATEAKEVADASGDATLIADMEAKLAHAQDLLYAAENTVATWQDAVNNAQQSAGVAEYVYSNGVDAYPRAQLNNPTESAPQSVLQAVRDQVVLGITSLGDINAAITEYYASQGLTPVLITNIEDIVDFSSGTYNDLQKEVLKTFGLSIETDAAGNPTGNISIVLTKEVEELNDLVPDVADGTEYMYNGYPYKFHDASITTNAEYLQQIADAELLIYNDYVTYEAAQSIYDSALNAYNMLNRPTYIGNSELTLLGTLTEDQETELLQVVKDLRAQGITSHILDCFAMDGTYLGGVYSFQLGGNTYYTTYADLNDAYASNIYSNNYIDDQFKMPYYNASYVTTRVDQQRKALLETDGSGRFTSIRFEDDSITYTLSTETVTDNEAYQDAMNKYYYENAKYDKMIQDINAKTSIIQREDQELELRLKQLDTEQNALKTEMEAVAKVVKDNVDASFKTFGG